MKASLLSRFIPSRLSSSPSSPSVSPVKLSSCHSVKLGFGFTLVELMIVIAIIGVLSATLFPMMSGYMARARDTATQANIRKIIPIITGYIQDTGGLPGTSLSVPWYCIPLKDSTTTTCRNQPVLPNLQTIPISVKDFNLQDVGYVNPLVGIRINGQTTIYNDEKKTMSGKTNPVYLLHWALPGTEEITTVYWEPESDKYTGAIRDKIIKLSQRCLPGKIKALNIIPGQTYCSLDLNP